MSQVLIEPKSIEEFEKSEKFLKDLPFIPKKEITTFVKERIIKDIIGTDFNPKNGFTNDHLLKVLKPKMELLEKVKQGKSIADEIIKSYKEYIQQETYRLSRRLTYIKIEDIEKINDIIAKLEEFDNTETVQFLNKIDKGDDSIIEPIFKDQTIQVNGEDVGGSLFRLGSIGAANIIFLNAYKQILESNENYVNNNGIYKDILTVLHKKLFTENGEINNQLSALEIMFMVSVFNDSNINNQYVKNITKKIKSVFDIIAGLHVGKTAIILKNNKVETKSFVSADSFRLTKRLRDFLRDLNSTFSFLSDEINNKNPNIGSLFKFIDNYEDIVENIFQNLNDSAAVRLFFTVENTIKKKNTEDEFELNPFEMDSNDVSILETMTMDADLSKLKKDSLKSQIKILKEKIEKADDNKKNTNFHWTLLTYYRILENILDNPPKKQDEKTSELKVTDKLFTKNDYKKKVIKITNIKNTKKKLNEVFDLSKKVTKKFSNAEVDKYADLLKDQLDELED